MKEFPKYKLYTSMFDILMWTYVYIHRLTSWKIILYDRVVWTQVEDRLLCVTRGEPNLKASQRSPRTSRTDELVHEKKRVSSLASRTSRTDAWVHVYFFFNHMHVPPYTTHVLIMYGFKLTCTRLRAVGISVDVAAGSYRRTIHTNTHTPAFVPPLIPARPANMHTYPNTCVHRAVDLQEINTERGHVSFSLLKRDKC